MTAAQENGSGAVMGLPILAADVPGMKPEDFSIVFPDTAASPYGSGSSGSQTTFNNAERLSTPRVECRKSFSESRPSIWSLTDSTSN